MTLADELVLHRCVEIQTKDRVTSFPTFWHALNMPAGWNGHHKFNQAWISDKHQFVYIENQKAGSRTILSILFSIDSHLRAFMLPYRGHNFSEWDGMGNETRDMPVQGMHVKPFYFTFFPSNYTTFTFVRNPLRSFASGAAEIIRRSFMFDLTISHLPHSPSWISLGCNKSTAHLTALAFMHDLLSANSLGTEAFHIWPQMLKLDVLLPNQHFDFVGRVEFLQQDLDTLFHMLHVQRALVGRRNSHANVDACYASNLVYDEVVSSPGLLLRFCDLYRADYSCLPYVSPCSSSDKAFSEANILGASNALTIAQMTFCLTLYISSRLRLNCATLLML